MFRHPAWHSSGPPAAGTVGTKSTRGFYHYDGSHLETSSPPSSPPAQWDVIKVFLPKDINGAVEDIKDVVDDNADDGDADGDGGEKEDGGDNMDAAVDETGTGGGGGDEGAEEGDTETREDTVL